jgi:hypothetical protein
MLIVAMRRVLYANKRWRTAITLTENTCTLDGDYELQFIRTCDPAQLSDSDCALVGRDNNVPVGYSLRSENFCAEITVEVSLSGKVQVFSDAGYQNPKTAYIVGDRAYFLVTVTSDLNDGYSGPNPPITFSKTEIKTVTIKKQSVLAAEVPIRLIERFITVNFGLPADQDYNPEAAIVVDPRSGNTVGFNFVFSRKLCNLLAANSFTKFTVGAEVKVTYGNLKKRGNLEILVTGEESATYSAEPELNDTSFTADTSSTKASTGTTTGTTSGKTSNAYAICASLILLIVALF